MEGERERGPGARIASANIAAVVGAMAVLIAGTAFLARGYRSERLARAARYYQAGLALERRGRPTQALSQYRNALVIDRTNHDYRLALALALMRLDRFDEAQVYLQELLEDDPASGIANLMLARIATKQGRWDSAIAYYHRAVYGYWAENARDNRIEASFELIDLLGKTGAAKQAVAQLLELADMMPDDPAGQVRIGNLLLQYGAPDQAASLFRDLARAVPRDPQAAAGFGRAEYELGNYAIAQRELSRAVRLDPGDTQSGELLARTKQILALDPTVRGLRAEERYLRSVKLLAETAAALRACYSGKGIEPPPAVQAQFDAAAAASTRPPRYSDAMETNITAAESLWSIRRGVCGQPPADRDTLARVLAELAR